MRTSLSPVISAHGFGGQADLPIPLGLAISGSVAALVLSFAVLLMAWRSPRYASPAGRPAPRWLDRVAASPASMVVLRSAGVVGFVYTVVVALWGKPDLTNPFFGIFFCWLWVGVPIASFFFGPVWRALNPMRTITAGLTRLSGGDPREGMFDYPERLGYWPAALGLFAFVWQELVSSDPTDMGGLRLWCAVYIGVMLIGGLLFGHRWFARADPFEVYSTLVAHLSVWARKDGRLVIRSPLANLATVPMHAGLVGVVGVLFGSTAFDSFKESNPWVRMIQVAPITGYTIDNLGLILFCCAAGGLLALAAMLTPSTGIPRPRLPRFFAHTVTPIIAAYILAHYLTFTIDTGIQTLARASDPFGKGWNILGTAGFNSNYWFSYHPTLLASLKVVAVVIGHVTAAAAAHDRSLEVLPRRLHLVGQLPILIVQVVFTAGGLYLLFSS
ncbi:MAG: hypothetical protein FWE71_08120 [Nocardioidaceae bacterium]|nr:hypothetical protein [Nocardioidaceae bacterium]MCL2613170.1 hypothetical protein [Nocardioidaceae bacterium]